MSAHVLPPLVVNSKSERKVHSLPPLGFELLIIGMLAHLSNHSTKSHPYDGYGGSLQMLNGYINGDAQPQHALNAFTWVIIPVVNPDGYVYTFTTVSRHPYHNH
jgi:hypothetical protein